MVHSLENLSTVPLGVACQQTRVNAVIQQPAKEANDRSRRKPLRDARGGATAGKQASSTCRGQCFNTRARISEWTTEDAAVTCRDDTVVRHGCALPAIVANKRCQAEFLG